MPNVDTKYFGKNCGMTLAEVVIAMAISAIVFTGMLVAYTDGISYTREHSSMMTMHNEGKAALAKMGKYIRRAGRVRIRPYGGVSNAQIELDFTDVHYDGGDVEFIFSKSNKNIKWNNRMGDEARLNMTLLPMLDTHTGPQQEPYLKVKDCRFTPLDHIGPPSPYLQGWGLIKVEMVLEDDRGDTLYMSSVFAKGNKLG